MKDHLRSLFEKGNHQREVLEAVYKLVLPEWDLIEKVQGYPEAGPELWAFICRLFMDFDKCHHPDVMPGGAWMNTGFSVNRELGPWKISLRTCTVTYMGGPDVEHADAGEIGRNTPAL